MAALFKRLFLIFALALSGWFGIGVAWAQSTNYDFSQSFLVNGNTQIFSGTFTTGSEISGYAGDYLITGWTNLNLTLGGTSYVIANTGVIPPFNSGTLGAYNPTNNLFDWYLSPYAPSNSGVGTPIFSSTQLGGYGGALSYWTVKLQAGSGSNSNSGDWVHGNFLENCADSTCTSGKLWQPGSNATTLGGAPEIDGSLAPKVGFLLGCLFLMFGRKKQNTEPMLSA